MLARDKEIKDPAIRQQIIYLARLSHQLRRETAKSPSGKGYPWNGGMI
jgi:hypothetical protein